MPKAIIIGATSGIGQGLAERLVQAGYQVGLTGRRQERLLQLQQSLNAHIQVMDVSQVEQAREQLQVLISDMGGMDLLVINAGISFRHATWEQESAILQTNVLGFAALAQAGMTYFLNRGAGHLVGISSIAGIRGRRNSISYSASKSFVSTYLQGCRQLAVHKNKQVAVTDIIPGFIATDLIQGHDELFWVAPLDKAIEQMMTAIKKKKSRAYITKRWRLIAWLLTFIPDWLHSNM